jgi:tetratricopeptide (TPR) repeat protein
MSNLLRMVEVAEKVGNNRSKAIANWMMGWIFLDREEFGRCRKCFKNWFDFFMQEEVPNRPNPDAQKKHWTAWYYFYLGLVDIEQRDINSAKSRLLEINSLIPDVLPDYKKWIKFYYNFLQAEIFLAEGAVDKAISTCEKSAHLGSFVPNYLFHHNPPFLKDTLARAYRENGEIEKAIAEYQRLTTFDPQREERYLTHPKYYYRLAKLYEQKVDKAQAIQNYEKFLDLWKDADPGLAEVDDARKRLVAIKNENP